MSLELWLYLISVGNNLKDLATFFCVFLTIGLMVFSFIAGIAYKEEMEKESKSFQKYAKLCLILLVLFGSISVLIPSGKIMYSIAAVHFGKEAIQSELSQKALSLLEIKIDKLIAESGK